MIRRRFLAGWLLAACASHAWAASNCITSGDTTKYTYFVAVDSTDKTTRETGLSDFTVYRSRNGGAAAAFTTPTINETDATNMPGVYELLLDEDMTLDSGDDVQHMVLHITHAGMEPVTKEICIARAKVTEGETLTVSSGAATVGTNNDKTGYSLSSSQTFSTTGSVGSVTGDIGGIAPNGLTLDAFHVDTNPLFGILRRGTAQSATSTTLVLDDGASFGDNTIRGATLWGCGSTQGYCQPRAIKEYAETGDTATVDEWEVTPSGTVSFWLFGTAPFAGGLDVAVPTPEEIADEVETRELTVGTNNDKTGYSLSSTQTFNNTGTWTGNITGNLGGTINGLTATAQGHVRTAVGLSSANLDTQLSTIDNVADGIKAVTDSLPDSGALTSLATASAQATAQAVLDKLDLMIEADGEDQRFTSNALELAPTGSGESAEVIAQEVAKTMFTYDSSETAAEAVSGSVVYEIVQNAGGGSAPSAEEVAAAVASELSDGAQFTAIPWNSDWDSEVESAAQTGAAAALTDYDPPTHAELTSALGNLNDLSSADVESAAEAGAAAALTDYDPPTKTEMDSAIAGLLTSQRIITGTCDSGSTTTCVDDALTHASEDLLKDRLICFDDGFCALITGFNPSNDTVTTTKTAPSTRASKGYTIFPSTVE